MITIHHNPRCSKSREALALLQALGEPLTVHEYLEKPLTLIQLQALQALLGVPARDMLRSSEDVYLTLNLADTSLDDEALLAAIAMHPQLLQRPIVVKGQRAVIARPPELALSVQRP